MKKVESNEEPAAAPNSNPGMNLDRKGWAALAKKHPEAYKLFEEWLHQYKKFQRWPRMFNETKTRPAPKYPDLPAAMQVGIFTQFCFDLAIDRLELTAPFQPYNIIDCVLDAIEQAIPKPPAQDASVHQINGSS